MQVHAHSGFAIALGHKLGHIQYAWRLAIGASSNDTAVAMENDIRRLKDPNGPTRIIHHPGDQTHGKQEFPGIPGQATCESSSEPALSSLEQSADTLSLIFLDEHPASALRLVSVSLV